MLDFGSRPGRAPSAHRRPPHSRPRLELLEDRTAPAVLVVNSTADNTTVDGQLTLREAIQAANTNTSVDGSPAGETSPDTIVFAAALQGSTITLGGTELALTGGGDLSIVGPGGVKGGITVNANNASRVFNISSPNAALLTNLTITGGNAGAGDVDGGGLINTGANATLANVRVTGNTASGAGADGGGIANDNTLTLDNVEVSNNTANDDGGGIYVNTPTTNATLVIRNGSRITGNTAINDDGGGLIITQSGGNTTTVTIEDTTIAGNTADGGGEGGGIRQNNGTVTIRRSTISGNVADTDGGGIDFTGGTLNVVNSTLTGNVAGQDGGGVQVATGTAVFTNTTVARNAAISDGGGLNRISGSATFNNSIIALNQASTGDDTNGVFTNNSTFIGTASGDPRLGPLQDNGGPTLTLTPLSGSPVLNAGNNALAIDPVSGAALTTDQRGTGFPRIVGGTVDQGAVERFSSTTTTTLEVLQNGAAVTGTSTALPVTLRATVASAATGITPTGTVDFFRDPTPNDPTDAPVRLNANPIDLDAMGVATLPNLNLPSTSGLFARYNPSSEAFASSASQAQTITATVRDTVGVFDPNAVFAELNRNTSGEADFSYSFGIGGDLPVVGNWTGSADGVDKPGVVRNVGGFLEWTLSDDNPPVLPNLPSFAFGTAGLIPLAGDWNGSGTDGIGLFDPNSGAFALKNAPSAGAADFTFTFGSPGVLPVVGDWDGDGTDTVGVYNPANGQWFLAGNSPATGFPALLSQFTFGGQPGSRPVAGDWDGDGTDGIGVFFPQPSGFGGFLLRQTPTPGPADVNGGNIILAGLANWLPVTGNWGPAPTNTNELLGLSAEGVGPGAPGISDGQLQAAVGGALDRLASAGADPVLLNTLINARFFLGDLPGALLGLADPAGGMVVIDGDAAGQGWFVDGTPWEDSEFAAGPVAGVDLLSVVLHEMGHLAGHGHDDGLMNATLAAGVRHTGALDAVFDSGVGAGADLLF